MKTLIEFEENGEVLAVETEPNADAVEIGVTIGPAWTGTTIGEGDTYSVTLDEDEVEDLIVALDQWLLERRTTKDCSRCCQCPCR